MAFHCHCVADNEATLRCLAKEQEKIKKNKTQDNSPAHIFVPSPKDFMFLGNNDFNVRIMQGNMLPRSAGTSGRALTDFKTLGNYLQLTAKSSRTASQKN